MKSRQLRGGVPRARVLSGSSLGCALQFQGAVPLAETQEVSQVPLTAWSVQQA